MTKQQQRSGDNSTNIQANGDVQITSGISYTDAKEIALDVYKQNAMACVGEAQQVALQRIEEFATALLQEMKKKHEEGVKAFANPDVQAVLLDAQKGYARSGEPNKKDVLVDLIIERTKNEQTPQLKDAIINESVKIVANLTQAQISLLTVCFLSRYTLAECRNLDDFKERVLKEYLPFLTTASFGELDLWHLEYNGCISIQAGGKLNFLGKMRDTYTAFFSKGVTKEDISKAVPDVDLGDLIIPCFHDSTKFQLGILNKNRVEGVFEAKGIDQKFTPQVKNLVAKNVMNHEEIKAFLLRFSAEFEEFLEVVSSRSNPLSNAHLTTVGRCIALSNLHANGKEGYLFDTWLT